MEPQEDWSHVFKVALLSSQQRAALAAIENNTSEMGQYLHRIKASVALFDLFNEPIAPSVRSVLPDERAPIDCRHLAARDGAMSIWHFSEVLRATGVLIRQCKPLSDKFDWPHLRTTKRLFSSYFPICRQVRHAIAHSSELMSHPDAAGKNAFKGDVFGLNVEGGVNAAMYNTPHGVATFGFIGRTKTGYIVVRDGLIGRTYTATREGFLLSYEITGRSALNLENVAKNFVSCFPFSPDEDPLVQVMQAARGRQTED